MTIDSNMIHQRIFNIMLFFTFTLSLFFILEGAIVGMPLMDNWKWILSMTISFVVYLLCKKGYCISLLKNFFFAFLIFFLLPIGWMSTASNSPFNIGYVFILLLSTCHFYKGKTRLLLSFFVILISTILIVFQTLYPNYFFLYTSEQLIVNSLLQIPLTLSVAAYMLSEFADALRSNNSILEKLSTHDDLTGIYNRRYVYNYLDHIISISNIKKPSMVGLIDVDNFKKINDTEGHQVGDEVMKKVAAHIKKSINHSGIAGRYGGDEFIIIFPNCSEKPCLDIITNLSILSHIHCSIDIKNPVTISGGFAIYDGTKTMDTVLALADQRLYKAKQNGKDQVILY